MWIPNLANATDHLARWCPLLSKFDFDVVPCAGIRNQNADSLPHLTATKKDQAPIEDDSLVAVLQTASKNNPEIRPVTETATLLDKADIRAVAQVVYDNDAENRRAAPKLQESQSAISRHGCLLQTSRRKCWPGKCRVYYQHE